LGCPSAVLKPPRVKKSLRLPRSHSSSTRRTCVTVLCIHGCAGHASEQRRTAGVLRCRTQQQVSRLCDSSQRSVFERAAPPSRAARCLPGPAVRTGRCRAQPPPQQAVQAGQSWACLPAASAHTQARTRAVAASISQQWPAHIWLPSSAAISRRHATTKGSLGLTTCALACAHADTPAWRAPLTGA
jgi:hypothetical protein